MIEHRDCNDDLIEVGDWVRYTDSYGKAYPLKITRFGVSPEWTNWKYYDESHENYLVAVDTKDLKWSWVRCDNVAKIDPGDEIVIGVAPDKMPETQEVADKDEVYRCEHVVYSDGSSYKQEWRSA